MGQSYSADIRRRVSRAVASGASRRAAARRYSVSESSAIRWVAREASEGSLAARKQGRPEGKGRLADHLAFLIAVVEAQPDITMPELAIRLLAERQAHGHAASISRLLCRAGFTYKKTADGVGMRTRRRR
jgi:transposase